MQKYNKSKRNGNQNITNYEISIKHSTDKTAQNEKSLLLKCAIWKFNKYVWDLARQWKGPFSWSWVDREVRALPQRSVLFLDLTFLVIFRLKSNVRISNNMSILYLSKNSEELVKSTVHMIVNKIVVPNLLKVLPCKFRMSNALRSKQTYSNFI